MSNRDLDYVFGVNKSSSNSAWIKFNSILDNHKELLKQKYNLSEVLSTLILNREISIDEIDNFINPKIENLMPDPSKMKDMDKTVKRLIYSIENDETIGIFGDYDVDGACSASIIKLFLNHINIKSEIHIPDRFKEGYGPNTNALKELMRKGCKLILTVDCGITAFEPIQSAKDLGMDVIIIDHHITGPELPKAYSVINPNRFDEENKLNYLSAAGVCFMLIVALRRKLKEKNFFNTTLVYPDLKLYLDLVALATVCDVVPLIELNRAFVKSGLKVMRLRLNQGIKALYDLSNINEPPDENNISFQIGPKINAAGRLGNSKLGVEILTSIEKVNSEVLAEKLESLNNQRKEIQDIIFEKAKEKIIDEKLFKNNVIVAFGKNWHEGVIGIIAGRIKEEFNKPTVIISINEKNIGKGSARSIGVFDFGSAVLLAEQSGLIIAGGGHHMAAGLTILEENIEKFSEFLQKKFLKQVKGDQIQKKIFVDFPISVNAANQNLLDDISLLSPFGSGNQEPIFAIGSSKITFLKAIGKLGNHFSFKIKDEGEGVLDCICFNAAGTSIGDDIKKAYDGYLINLVGYIKNNSFKNKPQLHVLDCSIVNF